MHRDASTTQKNDSSISNRTKESNEPLYISKHRERGLIKMNSFKKNQWIQEIRDRVLHAEQERLHGDKCVNITEARTILRKHINKTYETNK